MRKQGTLQPDGTYCRKGATCKRHGKTVAAQQANQLKNKINNLLEKPTPTWYEQKQKTTKPEWATPKHEQETLTEATDYYKPYGLKSPLQIPYWHPHAAEYDYLEIECDKETSLLIDPKHRWNSYGNKNRTRQTLWLTKNGQTVAMVSYLVTHPESETNWGETTIGDIETHPNHRGKGYSTEIIHLAEKHMINTKIHSGGHYTPEGEKYLKGKLPYTNQALEEEKQAQQGKPVRGIGTHFNTMTFIHDWEHLQTK